mmetsp:Transcript_6484/g.19173  ORF Transcript_6484/g.19173 Transcript_6484/m.19173 type:complete len:283 (-) Transcript_6484:384-1232(-)
MSWWSSLATSGTSSDGRTLHCAWFCRSWSAKTIATIESTMGTALGTTQGSCLPLKTVSTSSASLVTVFCLMAMVEVGLKAMWRTMFSPFEMPPWMPPDLFVFVLILLLPAMSSSTAVTNSSLCSLPVMVVDENPLPISKPLVAGRDIMALASSASSLSKTGDPKPQGQFLTTQVTVPPHDSLCLLMLSISLIILSEVSSCGQRTMLSSTSSTVKASWSTASSGTLTSFTLDTHAMISVPATFFSKLFAIAPAATRPIVSLALLLPPPATALTPYLASYVASA